MMTPPSSNEDSPPTYFVSSPTSTSFQGPEVFGEAMDYMPINIRTNVFTDPAMIEYEDLSKEIRNYLSICLKMTHIVVNIITIQLLLYIN